jgi:type IV secretory pathway VirB10-like protein
MSEAEQRAEKTRMEAENRAKNDLDSSPVAVDYSEFFAKEKEVKAAADTKPEPVIPVAAVAPTATPTIPPQLVASATPMWPAGATPMTKGDNDTEFINPPIETSQPEPREDYVFDAAYGKKYRLMEATIVETVLVNRLAGAAAGPVIAMVTTDVYSHSGQHLLIPKGTRLLGSVTAVSGRDQERLFVAFHRMIEPDGYSVSLDKFKGLDVVGQTGLRDLVNHHYTQIFGASLALAAVAATTQVGAASSFATYDFGASMRSGASQGFGQAAEQVMTRFLNILPTFTIREKTRIKVMLANDLLLYDVKNHNMDPDL